MFDYSTQTLSAKEEIVARLKEYDTLRAEIIGRTAAVYQLLAISAPLAVFLFTWWGSSTQKKDWVFWLAVVIFTFIVGLFAMSTRRDINRIAERIIFIEREVNRLAGVDILEWETTFGAASTGWWRLRRGPSSRSALPKHS